MSRSTALGSRTHAVRLLGSEARDPGLERLGSATDFSSGGHGIEHAGDDLGRACAARFVRRLRFEQLCVREDDAELIVQAVEQETKI